MGDIKPFLIKPLQFISINRIPSKCFNSMLFLLPLQEYFKSSHANFEVIVSYSLLEELLHLANVLFFEFLEIIKLLLLHFYCFHECVDVIVLVL